MSDRMDKRVGDAFLDDLNDLVLTNGDAAAWDDLCAEASLAVIQSTLTTGDELRTAAKLVALGVDFGRRTPDAPADLQATVKSDPQLARALFDACCALSRGTPADGPLPPNPYLVSQWSDGRIYFHTDENKLSAPEALLLGVWLIAVADPTLSDAVPMLLRVATR